MRVTPSARGAEDCAGGTFLRKTGTRAAIVLIKGKIDQGDEVKFRNTAMAAQSAIVFLEGRGGVIGRMRGFETAVADGATCTSTRALVWLGGSPRRMGEDARTGFHEPLDPSTGRNSDIS